MSFNTSQFKDLIERVLKDHIDLHSPSAVNLLLGTAAVESDFGTYLRQIKGPAKGVFQIEQETFEWLRDLFRYKHSDLGRMVFEELEWNLRASILVCRLRYWVVPSKLPEADDIGGLANYWKAHYNTYLGKGTVEDFVKSYEKFVKI